MNASGAGQSRSWPPTQARRSRSSLGRAAGRFWAHNRWSRHRTVLRFGADAAARSVRPEIYLQDATGGIKVYLRSADYPALAAGDRVRVTGWTRQFHGEVDLSGSAPSDLTRIGPGEPPGLVYAPTGQVDETCEGQLILIAGAVVKFEPNALTLDDGTGPARIFFPAELPWRRPYVEIGEFWAAHGVVGQYAAAPWESGYQVIPRFRADVSDAPLVLPVTGSE